MGGNILENHYTLALSKRLTQLRVSVKPVKLSKLVGIQIFASSFIRTENGVQGDLIGCHTGNGGKLSNS